MVFVFLSKLNYSSIYELDIKLHAFVTVSIIICQVGKLRIKFKLMFFVLKRKVFRFF
jgi:hypothetical protein